MVFQNYALYPHMTVAENIGYGMKVRGTPKAEIDKAVTDAARILNLGAYLNRKPSALSGGQRQRVAIGRAIVRQPDVFLFDEPLSNLDAKLRIEMRTEIKLLHRRLQTTAVYVTHDQVEAMTMADKVVVLNGGKIEQVGSPLDLYHQPANLFVAGFLGTPKMGFLKGRITRVDDQGCEVQLDAGTRISLPLSGTNLTVGGAVTLGIRPEHLELAKPGDCTLQVTADVSERLGSDTFCHVRTTSGEALTMRVRGDLASRYGETLSLHLDAEHCHLFDADGVALTRPLRVAA
jgi:multiple sugar transport system ATP-binding protein